MLSLVVSDMETKKSNNIRDFPIIHLGDPPPKSDKTLYTGIYLPTFREGTNFIIKLLVSCLGALTGPGGAPPLVFIMVFKKTSSSLPKRLLMILSERTL